MAQSFRWPSITRCLQCVGVLLCAISFVQKSHAENRDLQIFCETPQFSEIGTSGLISCLFAPAMLRFYWYKTYSNGTSRFLISHESHKKSGDGYTSGEYDIADNGSLIIRSVSSRHAGYYEVVSLDATERTKAFSVYLITTGSFEGQRPKIDVCEHEAFCLTEYLESKTISCSFEAVSPPPTLEWYRLYSGGKELVDSVKFSQPDESSNVLVVATVFVSSLSRRILQVLSCEATWTSLHSKTLSATVVLDNTKDILPINEAHVVSKTLLEFAHYNFVCDDINTSLISVWKKKSEEDRYRVVAYSYSEGFYKHTSARLLYDDDGDVIQFRPVKKKDEGTYFCLTSDGLSDSYVFFRVYVQPSAPPTCITPQYVQMDTRGYIFCNFPPTFSAVYWYYGGNGTGLPLVSSPPEEVTAKQQTTNFVGEFDISNNGSLIIEKVGIQNEGDYTVKLLDPNDIVFTLRVKVIVTVPPRQQRPSVNLCESGKFCLTEYDGSKSLTCRLDNVKPLAEVVWYTQESTDREGRLHNQVTWSEAGKYSTFSTVATIPLSALPPKKLQLLLCKATWPSSDSQPLLSNVVVENFRTLLPFDENNFITVDLPKYAKKRLPCGRNRKEIDFIFLWKFSPSYSQYQFHDLAYTYYDSYGVFMTSPMSVSILKSSLSIGPADEVHNGIYVCIAGNGTSQGVTLYNVTVLRPPSPRYITVEQCASESKLCLINEAKGFLECHVSYVYPAVQLEISADESDRVKLFKVSSSVDKEVNSFNVSVRAEYEVELTSVARNVTVYCHASGKAAVTFERTREITIVISGTILKDNLPTDEPVTSNIMWIFISVGTFIVVIIIFGMGLCRIKL